MDVRDVESKPKTANEHIRSIESQVSILNKNEIKLIV